MKKNDLWQWPEVSVGLRSWAPVIRCIWVCLTYGSVQQYAIYLLVLEKAKVHCACSFCTEHSIGDILAVPQVCTSPVTTAERQRGANGCCYGWFPEHLLWVTPLFHCHLAPIWQWRHAISVSPSEPAPDRCRFFATGWWMIYTVEGVNRCIPISLLEQVELFPFAPASWKSLSYTHTHTLKNGINNN